MAGRAEALQVGPIPEEQLVAVVTNDVVDIGGKPCLSVASALDTQGVIEEDAKAKSTPAGRVIPPTRGRIGAGLFLEASMSRAVSPWDQMPTAWSGTRLQGMRRHHPSGGESDTTRS